MAVAASDRRLQRLSGHFKALKDNSTSMAAAQTTNGKEEFSLSTHVLDTSLGTPGIGMKLTLQSRAKADDAKDVWTELGAYETNSDGRLSQKLPLLPAGTYRIIFHVEEYYAKRQTECFFPDCTIAFKAKTGHYHVPLLISPWGFTTYRGS